MSTTANPVLYWTPRILGILFAGFISLFALDVFGAGYSSAEALVALAIHLIPTALVLIAVALGWRREWLGALLFAALGVAYFVLSGGQQQWSAYLLIAGPLFLLAALFAIGWLSRTRRAG
jgi:glucose-6-phosphate-specific signal transduction histidine kinase